MLDATASEFDLAIIGAGPAGLYATYYAGFRGLRVAVLDSLEEAGGQVTALYPEKPIYDIAALPAVRGRDLISSLLSQAEPFKPEYLLGEQVTGLERKGDTDDPGFTLQTASGRTLHCGAVLITGGIGTFTPRPLPGADGYLGRGLIHFVPALQDLADQDVLIVGGGDSALDWALALEGIAKSITLVHRRAAFRAHEHSVKELHASRACVIAPGRLDGILPDGVGHVAGAVIRDGDEQEIELPVQTIIAALGFTANLGPMTKWGLELSGRHIAVDTRMRTNLPGVYAAGDITEYEGKVRLISVGFGEAATAVNNAVTYLQPDADLFPGHSSDSVPQPTAR